jgi:asparagine synthase (glutamine-hydrolysing)
MCGIVGAVDYSGRLPTPEVFAKCMDRLELRGPDDRGTWSGPYVQLGHRRLSIVDLSPAGHQPMISGDGRYVIVFNGEIFNHCELRARLAPADGWKGTSDTETLLEAYREWGVGCLPRLNGMFAFAIWDKSERKLFAARDRMGVKPFYYGWRYDRFVFASRPSALAGLLGDGGSDISTQALRLFFELGYIPGPVSFYEGVHKLRPGHYLLLDESGPREIRYWDFRHIPPDESWLRRSENDLIDELDALVRSAVRIRLMSDVPLGAFLSGGTDSAYIVAAMKNSGVSEPKTFTIAFREQQYNEAPVAARIAQHIGVDHSVETLSVSELLGLLPLYVDQFDEPFADSSAFPTMAAARLARSRVTVALTGDAGDELFGGYHYYSLIELLSRTIGWPASAKRMLRAALSALPAHRAKLLAGALRPGTPVGMYNFLRSFAKDFEPLLTAGVLEQTDSSADCFEQTAAGFALGLTSAEVGMRLDMAWTLTDSYLQKVDVATMAFSLEARCPFIDYRLLEWSMKLPVQFKLRGWHGKYLLKKALCRYLPRELVYRPKRGFGMPVDQWLRGPLNSWAREILHDDSLLSRLPLERERIRSLFELHGSGSRNAHPLLWAVLMLLCYVARHDSSMSLPPIAIPRAA